MSLRLVSILLHRRELELDGRPALRLQGEATGEGLLDAGTRTTRIAVDLDGETLVLSTQEVDGVDYERAVDVLDEIAASVRIA